MNTTHMRIGLLPRLFLGAGGILLLLAFTVAGMALVTRAPALALLASVLGLLAMRRGGPARDADPSWDPSATPWRPTDNLGLLRLFGTCPTGLGLPLYLGEVEGAHRWLDLRRAPHVLVAGTTGSGKSQWLRTALVSLTGLTGPDALRLILIDPKRVELAPFKGLPHVSRHVTDPADARKVLDGLSREMDRRYSAMEAAGVADVSGLPPGRSCPFIVVAADEFADLILSTRRTAHEVEPVLARLLSLGRAAGIHVLLATQRPDRTVVTGLIKANAPARVAFRCANSTESRIILDGRGAEALGRPGDGLVVSHEVQGEPGRPVPFRGLMVPEDAVRRYGGLTNPTGRV